MIDADERIGELQDRVVALARENTQLQQERDTLRSERDTLIDKLERMTTLKEAWRQDDHVHAAAWAEANENNAALEQRVIAITQAVTDILAGKDCPMCDSGRLRNPEKTHWPECAFGQAQQLIAKE